MLALDNKSTNRLVKQTRRFFFFSLFSFLFLQLKRDSKSAHGTCTLFNMYGALDRKKNIIPGYSYSAIFFDFAILHQIKGATLGVIGYGDIGQTAARKAKAMGMNIIGQRRRPELSQGDGIADEVLGVGQVTQ